MGDIIQELITVATYLGTVDYIGTDANDFLSYYFI